MNLFQTFIQFFSSKNIDHSHSNTNLEDKIRVLVEAVEHHNQGQQMTALHRDENTIQIDVPSDLDKEESDFE